MSETTARVAVTIGTKADPAAVDRYAASVQRMRAALKDLFASPHVATAGAAFGGTFAAAGASVSAMVSRITAAISGSSELAAEMALVERRTGLAGEAFQVLSRAGRASSEELIAAFAKLRVKLGDALGGDADARKLFAGLGLSPEALARVPMERLLETLAVALGRFGDRNREAAEAQAIFGRGYAALIPVLERLRTEGYDKLRESVSASAGVLGKDMSEALGKAKKEASAAGNELSIALAQTNLRLLQIKSGITRMLAENAGTIQSVGTGIAGGFLTASVLTALSTKVGPQLNVIGSQAASAFSKGFGVGAALLPGIIAERLGTPTALGGIAALGRALATPFGAAFAVAAGAIIISELQRIALEKTERRDALLAGGTAEINALRDRIKTAASQDDARRAAADAAALLATRRDELTQLETRQQTLAERHAQLSAAAARAGATALSLPTTLSEEDQTLLERNRQDIAALEKVVEFARAKGAALAAANQAQRTATDLAFAEAAELEKTRARRESLLERETQHRYDTLTDDQSRLAFLAQWRADEAAAFDAKIAATKNAELATDRELEKRVRLADIDAKIAQLRHRTAEEAARAADEADREISRLLERLDRSRRAEIMRDLDTAYRDTALHRARTEGDPTATQVERHQARLAEMQSRAAALATTIAELETRARVAAAQGLDTEPHAADLQRLRDEQTQLQIDWLNRGPDPTSWVEQTAAALTQLRDQWGTTAQQIAQTVSGTIGSAVDSVADHLTQALLVTGDWGRALQDIALSLGTEVVRAIIAMGARWVATQIMMAVAGKTLAAASLAASLPIAAAQSTLWAGPATLATIASWGGAAAAAPFQIAGAVGLTQALAAAPGYLEGGPVAGRQLAWLSEDGRPEFVFSAPAVEALGMENLEAMHRAALNPSTPAGLASTAAAPTAKSARVINIIDDGSTYRRDEIDALIADPRFANHVVRTVRSRRSEIGVQL